VLALAGGIVVAASQDDRGATPGSHSEKKCDRTTREPPDLACRLALRPREAAAALGLSERTLRTLLPALPHVRAGGIVLLPVDALRRWLEDETKAGEERTSAVAREILESVQGDK
jgi:excisionase family DNA binding protein